MKKKISKKFLIPFISACFISITGIIWACAGGDDFYDYFISFFAPEIIQSPESAPFYRSSQTFYGSQTYNDAVSVFDSVNIEEWYTAFSKKASRKDLEYMVYRSRIGEVDTMIFFLKNPTYPISRELKSSSVFQVDDKAFLKESLFYLGFAKRCEPFATYSPGWWGEKSDDPRSNTSGMEKLIGGGNKVLTNVKTDFIRERYHFQVIRLLYNDGNLDDCISYYEQHQADFKTGNTIAYRALGYVAACYYAKKNFSKANYLYAVLYDKCPTIKQTAYLSFHPQEEADWKGSLALAKNNREKAALWQMLGLYADPLRAMKEIYLLDPKSDLLNLLLVRAVNINEEQFIPNATDYYDSKKSSHALIASKTDQKLLEFIKKVADTGNAQKGFLWNLSTGYLLLATGDFNQAGKYFDKAEKEQPSNEMLKDQVRSLRLMSKIETYKKADARMEDELTTELQWLAKANHPQSSRILCINNWALSRLSEKYRAWGDSVKAQCLDHDQNPRFYDNEQNINALIALMDKPHPSKFEQYILSIHPYTRNDLFDYKAISLIYQYKFKEALAMYDASKGSGDLILTADPFVIHINDCHDCDFVDTNRDSYTKYTFVQKLASLQEAALKDPKKAGKSYYLLANGLYNMTYYGNARDVYGSRINSYAYSGYVDFYYDKEKLSNQIFDCTKAMEYYQKAMDASPDKEFKAECCFMAAKCEQNIYFSSPGFNYETIIKSGEYFRKLKSDFSKTDYYKEIIEECTYFSTYLGIHKKG